MKIIFQDLCLFAWFSKATQWVTLQDPGGLELGWDVMDPECPAFIRRKINKERK